MQRLAILHLTREFPDAVTGGIEQSIAIAAQSQPNTSHTVLCLGSRGQAMRSHVERVRVWRVEPMGSAKFFPLSIRWFALFRRLVQSADVVHVHAPFPLGELTSRMTSTPVVCTYHADLDGYYGIGRLYWMLQRRWLQGVGAVIATSEHYDASSPVLSRLPSARDIIPFGLPPTDHSPARPPDEMPEVFFLFLGSLRWYKGLDTLITAAKQTGLPLVVAGDGDFRHLVETEDHPIYWLGQVSDAQRTWLLMKARALILPSISRAEAFGLVLLESMRAGKPAICTRLGTATDWLVQDEQTGLVVDPGDAEGLAQAMQRLWSDDGFVSELGDRAAQRFQAQFESRRYAEALTAVYERVAR